MESLIRLSQTNVVVNAIQISQSENYFDLSGTTALALWAVGVTRYSTPTSSRPDPHPIRDFFAEAIVDYAPKDHPAMMERPFFSIAKRKRLKPIEYSNADKSIWVKVKGDSEHGMATIWDSDVLIYCISKIVAARDAGDNDHGPSVFVTPHELLKSIARGTSGRDYQELLAAIKRLKTTTIETNIRGGKNKIAMFNWLAEVEGEGREATDPSQLKMLELRISNWLYKGIMSGQGVLTLDREWFLLKGGLERVIYRIARKHAGDQPQGWTCRLEVLHAKTGSEAPMRNFAVAMRKLIARNDLPRYVMAPTTTKDGAAAIHFLLRSLAPPPFPNAASQREEARAVWIDSGRDPRAFETYFKEWTDSGAPVSQFIEQFRDLVITSSR